MNTPARFVGIVVALLLSIGLMSMGYELYGIWVMLVLIFQEICFSNVVIELHGGDE